MAQASLEERQIWVDGQLLPWAEAQVHVLSQSVQRGSLVFDVMPCYWNPGGPVIFGMREHTERFVNSASLSEMSLGFSLEELLNAIRETARANPGCQIVKISGYYPGVSLDVLPSDGKASVAIAAFAIPEVVTGVGSGKFGPARLQIADCRKMPPWVLSPQAKLAAGYLYTSIAKRRAKREGFDDVLLLDERGEVAESSTQSFFLVEGGALRTAVLDYVLAGITRRAVIELAKDEGISVREGPIPAGSLDSAEGAFMTGTTANIWPVSHIDQHALPVPVPDLITKRLMERFAAVIMEEDPVFSPRWMQKV